VSERDIEVGATLAGKYRIERVLGQGGMGVVVEATQLDLERRVALKFLRIDKNPDTRVALLRFEREARTVARLRGDHVVQVFDVGKLDQGEPFIVMELLRGEDLCSVLEREQRLPLATAVDYTLQICEAMAEAHVAGVIHRDLKPSNVFLTRRTDGRPLIKVLDFGISKLSNASTASLGLTNGMVGSAYYMSPEQLQAAHDIDHRTDIWSIGTILYELVTGCLAFDADVFARVCTRILTGAPTPITDHVRDTPKALEAVIGKCLEKSPNARYANVGELAQALVPFARPSSLAYAEAALRIVQGAGAEGAAQTADSFRPVIGDPADFNKQTISVAVDTGLLVSRTASSNPSAAALAVTPGAPNDGTVNISGNPPPQSQELKPVVSTQGRAQLERARSGGARGLLLIAAVVAAATLVGVIALRGKPDASSSKPPTNSAPTEQPTSAVQLDVPPPAPLAPAAVPVLDPSAQLAVESVAPPVPSLVPARNSKAAQNGKTQKSKPTPEDRARQNADMSPEDMLRHR
jgi:serine/threonine-protein kinase